MSVLRFGKVAKGSSGSDEQCTSEDTDSYLQSDNESAAGKRKGGTVCREDSCQAWKFQRYLHTTHIDSCRLIESDTDSYSVIWIYMD